MTSINALRDKLAASIEGDLRCDAPARAVYSTDHSNSRRVPIGVVVPRHDGDVMRAIELARENSLPILPRGGGTALGGQTANTALVLDFSKYMNAIGRIDAEKRVAIVQPGVVQTQL